MKVLKIAAVFIFLGGAAQAETSWEQHLKPIAKKAFSPSSFVKTGAGALLQHVRDSPPEWGQGAAGLGKRFGSTFGKHLVGGSVQMSVGTLLHEDLTYHPSEKTGFAPRLKYAILSTLIARDTTTGDPTPAFGRFSGALAGGFVSRTWQPVRLHTISSGFESSGVSLGADAAMNIIREFWPEIRHPRRGR